MKKIIVLLAVCLCAPVFAQNPASSGLGAGNPAVIEQNLNQPFRESIYVGRYGYWRNMPVKVAYLTFLPGKGKKVPAKFSLCKPDGTVVFTAKPELMKKPGGVLAPVGKNFPGEQIYALNFTSFELPGRYYIKVHGYGSSDLFNIGGNMPDSIYPLPSLKTFEEQSHILDNNMKPIIQDSFLYTPLRYPVDTTP